MDHSTKGANKPFSLFHYVLFHEAVKTYPNASMIRGVEGVEAAAKAAVAKAAAVEITPSFLIGPTPQQQVAAKTEAEMLQVVDSLLEEMVAEEVAKESVKAQPVKEITALEKAAAELHRRLDAIMANEHLSLKLDYLLIGSGSGELKDYTRQPTDYIETENGFMRGWIREMGEEKTEITDPSPGLERPTFAR